MKKNTVETKQWLDKHYGNSAPSRHDEVIAETEAYFDEKEKSYYKSGIEKLENRNTRCIALEGKLC